MDTNKHVKVLATGGVVVALAALAACGSSTNGVGTGGSDKGSSSSSVTTGFSSSGTETVTGASSSSGSGSGSGSGSSSSGGGSTSSTSSSSSASSTSGTPMACMITCMNGDPNNETGCDPCLQAVCASEYAACQADTEASEGGGCVSCADLLQPSPPSGIDCPSSSQIIMNLLNCGCTASTCD